MSTAANPLFGRRWKLTLAGPSNSTNQTQQVMVIDSTYTNLLQPFKLTFDVRTVWFRWYWEATIRIYNLNEQCTQWILSQGGTTDSSATPSPGPTVGSQQPPIQQGMQVTLEAGYVNPGQYGTIFVGYVLQPMFDRENQTDFVITLNCIIGLDEISRNSLNRVYPAGTDQLSIVQDMAANAFNPISSTAGNNPSITPSLAGKKLSRQKVVFGTPDKFFTEIARNNNMEWWLSQKGILNVGNLNFNLPASPSYIFTPQNGIIGTPTQTQQGVECRLLLNPNVQVTNPPMAVAIDNTVIQQLLRQPGQPASAISILSPSGTYIVVAARYVGDTRGQEWYTDWTGWLLASDKIAAIEAATGVQFDRP